MTVSNMCNMRCEHCAVGDTLVFNEPGKIELGLMLRRLEEVEQLETISITGGEPSFSEATVRDYIVPLLKYARSRGVRSQINSNLTLDYGRYEMIAPHLDVMHISYNYTSASDFYEIGFAKSAHRPAPEVAYRMYDRMVENTRRLAEDGLFVSAESMINYRTFDRIADIHRHIAELGCLRHEVHPMYPSSFAASLPVISRQQMLASIDSLLTARDRSIWLLFGTLPFFPCSEDEQELDMVQRLAEESNVTVRNDPDGRNRLNVNLFTGDVFVTDFSDVPAFGNVSGDRLEDVFNQWLGNPLARSVDCHCPAAGCCGPNLLVKDMYYQGVDFTTRKAVR
jgi:radical SAM/CxCxxxxC motif protein YfkAB